MNSSKERRKLKQLKKKLKRLPTNLRKQAIRESRNALGMQQQKKPERQKWHNINARRRATFKKYEFERAEHNAMLAATSQELQHILAESKELSDVHYDSSPAELWAKIVTAEHCDTTIYVQRDGLSTLNIVLHQRSPTLAQLKKAIASITLAQHKRRQRNERRALAEDHTSQHEANAAADAGNEALPHRNRRSSCELVNSALRNGHEHRALVSWRFLWRCFTLYNVETNQAIDENSAAAANGRATLTSLGIENGARLKFVHREKYFGRRRQT